MIEEYAALPYTREQLPFIPKCDIQFVISDQLFLDVLLMKIRSKRIPYATMKKRVDQEKERDLQNTIQSLETKIKLTEDDEGKLESYKQELIALRKRWREFCFDRKQDGSPKAKKTNKQKTQKQLCTWKT